MISPDAGPNSELLKGMMFDESAGPVISVCYPLIASIDGIETGFAMFRRMCEKYKRVAWVIDMRRFNPITSPASIRRAFADAYEASRYIIEPATICEARLYGSAVVRGLCTAVDWVLKRPYDIKSFDDIPDAMAFARKSVDTDLRKRAGLGHVATSSSSTSAFR